MTTIKQEHEKASLEQLSELAQAMEKLSKSLDGLVTYLKENPELPNLPQSINELNRRLSILSTRL